MATIQAQHQGKLQMDTQSIDDGVVVIAGGIIGLSTAYSLALSLQEMAQDFTPDQHSRLPKITVVESSERLCPAASSQATGGLGDFGFGENKTGVAGVSSLSYKVYVELAETCTGRGRYGFGRHV
jgi:glycine/D-amino acid oxidase-like deaminating enzyme